MLTCIRKLLLIVVQQYDWLIVAGHCCCTLNNNCRLNRNCMFSFKCIITHVKWKWKWMHKYLNACVCLMIGAIIERSCWIWKTRFTVHWKCLWWTREKEFFLVAIHSPYTINCISYLDTFFLLFFSSHCIHSNANENNPINFNYFLLNCGNKKKSRISFTYIFIQF